MYQNCCKKCGSVALHTEVKGNNTGLYCDDCGAWVKWLGKDELRAFEYYKKSKLLKTRCNIPIPKLDVVGAPGIIAKIKLCGGAFTINVDETMQWKKPTDEQIKNLHDMLCIDVEMLGE